MEVAHHIYDVINGTLEADTLKYLSPSKCITRMHELTSAKPSKELRLDASGHGITVTDTQPDQCCSLCIELDVLEAMSRKSLAFDAAGLIDYGVFQKWIKLSFQSHEAAATTTRFQSTNNYPQTGRPSFARKSSTETA